MKCQFVIKKTANSDTPNLLAYKDLDLIFIEKKRCWVSDPFEIQRLGDLFNHIDENSLEIPDIQLVGIELGGGYSNKGSATIICNIDGLPLKPMALLTKYACSNHALFIGNALIEVNASAWNKGEFSFDVKSYQIENHIVITKSLIQRNMPFNMHNNKEKISEELPEKLEYLLNAILAAGNKCCCYHCRSVHYADINYGMEELKKLQNERKCVYRK